MCTWRMRNHQIPPIIEDFQHVTLDVVFRVRFTFKQVTTPGIVTTLPERIADDTAELTCHEYPHLLTAFHIASISIPNAQYPAPSLHPIASPAATALRTTP